MSEADKHKEEEIGDEEEPEKKSTNASPSTEKKKTTKKRPKPKKEEPILTEADYEILREHTRRLKGMPLAHPPKVLSSASQRCVSDTAKPPKFTPIDHF